MCAIPGTGGVLRIAQSAEISTYTTGKRLVFPNFAAFDSEGNRYLTDSGDCDKANGRLLLVRPTGEVEVLIGSYLHYLNRMAIDPSGSWLYLAQTTASNILRFPIEGIRLGDPEIYATIPGTAPDGLALAENGNLYVGCYTPDAIYVIEPGGRVELLVIDPWADLLNRPTNLAFGELRQPRWLSHRGASGQRRRSASASADVSCLSAHGQVARAIRNRREDPLNPIHQALGTQAINVSKPWLRWERCHLGAMARRGESDHSTGDLGT